MLDSSDENVPSIIPDLGHWLQTEEDENEFEIAYGDEDFTEIERLLSEQEWKSGTLQDELIDLCQVPALNGDYCNERAAQNVLIKNIIVHIWEMKSNRLQKSLGWIILQWL